MSLSERENLQSVRISESAEVSFDGISVVRVNFFMKLIQNPVPRNFKQSFVKLHFIGNPVDLCFPAQFRVCP